jgi:hypothetical protein
MRQGCALAVAVALAGCSGGASAPPLAPPGQAMTLVRQAVRHSVGLGKVLTSKNGEIYGYDIDQNGSDGVLATASDVETFDQDSGKLTKTFPKHPKSNISYSVVGITTGDVGLIIKYVVPKGTIYANRYYEVMNPVTKNNFTGQWKPPVKDIQVESAGPNQSTSTTGFFAIKLKNQDNPIVFSSDVATDTFGSVYGLNPSEFSLGDQPQFAQDTSTGQAVIATSPDGGAVGGAAPINVLIDLSTGYETQFTGLNNGFYGAGFVNGLAVDSTTGIAATTTELNAQVEFYNLAQETGTFAQLPCTSNVSQYYSAWGVTNDPVNGLFLVSSTYYACSESQGSVIFVYDESGNLEETITGFSFPIGPGGPAINPSKRMGWAVGPKINQLQQFSY